MCGTTELSNFTSPSSPRAKRLSSSELSRVYGYVTTASVLCFSNLGFLGRPAKSTNNSQSSNCADSSHLLGLEEAFYLFSLGPNCSTIGQLGKDFELVSQDSTG